MACWSRSAAVSISFVAVAPMSSAPSILAVRLDSYVCTSASLARFLQGTEKKKTKRKEGREEEQEARRKQAKADEEEEKNEDKDDDKME